MSTLLLLMMMITENHARTRMCGKVNSPVERERERGNAIGKPNKAPKACERKGRQRQCRYCQTIIDRPPPPRKPFFRKSSLSYCLTSLSPLWPAFVMSPTCSCPVGHCRGSPSCICHISFSTPDPHVHKLISHIHTSAHAHTKYVCNTALEYIIMIFLVQKKSINLENG